MLPLNVDLEMKLRSRSLQQPTFVPFLHEEAGHAPSEDAQDVKTIGVHSLAKAATVWEQIYWCQVEVLMVPMTPHDAVSCIRCSALHAADAPFYLY